MERVRILEEIQRHSQPDLAITYEDLLRDRVARWNAQPGSLPGEDCPLCRNKGVVAILRNGEEIQRECQCMPKRRTLQRIERSGLKYLLKEYTFEGYETKTPWQKKIKASALDFVENHGNRWFYIGGQVGAGKTHICTAIVGELLARGLEARYMLWRDEAVRLKAAVNEEGYSREIARLKETPALYIDDLFKTEQGKNPTAADINLAFELLNWRYNNPNLITILSSEKTTDELLSVDQAVGSRIYQRSKGFCWNLTPDNTKNWRLYH